MKSSVEAIHEDAVTRPGGTPGEVFAAFLKLDSPPSAARSLISDISATNWWFAANGSTRRVTAIS